jgi:hypothetical protein
MSATNTGFEQVSKAIRKVLTGILVGGFALAFALWAFRPVTGYLKPVLNEEGILIGMEYEHLTWWGLRHQTLQTIVKYDEILYEKDGRWHPVDEHLYTGNVGD